AKGSSGRSSPGSTTRTATGTWSARVRPWRRSVADPDRLPLLRRRRVLDDPALQRLVVDVLEAFVELLGAVGPIDVVDPALDLELDRPRPGLIGVVGLLPNLDGLDRPRGLDPELRVDLLAVRLERLGLLLEEGLQRFLGRPHQLGLASTQNQQDQRYTDERSPCRGCHCRRC